jgi:hypothetical protein
LPTLPAALDHGSSRPSRTSGSATAVHRRSTSREVIDLCILGDGPGAVMVALSARERGLSVVLITNAPTPSTGSGVEIVGHRHPLGYRWLTHRYGGRAARSFRAAIGAGRRHLERLVANHALPCTFASSTCYLGAVACDAGQFRRELEALHRAGLPTQRATPAAGLVSTHGWHRLPDERALDRDAFLRCGADLAGARGAVIDASRTVEARRRPVPGAPWDVTTERERYRSRHLVQTDASLADQRRMWVRSVLVHRVLIDTRHPLPVGRYVLHARRPVEVVAHDREGCDYQQLTISQFGGRSPVDTGFEGWVTRTWSDGLIRDRWWGESPIRGGFPVYGQVGHSGHWLLGSLDLWGMAVQAQVGHRVTAAIEADRSGSTVVGNLAWARPVRILPGAAS